MSTEGAGCHQASYHCDIFKLLPDCKVICKHIHEAYGEAGDIYQTAAGISGPGQPLLGKEDRLKFQAECLNSSLLASEDLNFLYLNNPNNLCPKLVILLYFSSVLNAPKHSLFSVISP